MNVKTNTIYGLKRIDKTQFSLYSHYFFTFTLYFDKNGLLRVVLRHQCFINSARCILYRGCS